MIDHSHGKYSNILTLKSAWFACVHRSFRLCVTDSFIPIVMQCIVLHLRVLNAVILWMCLFARRFIYLFSNQVIKIGNSHWMDALHFDNALTYMHFFSLPQWSTGNITWNNWVIVEKNKKTNWNNRKTSVHCTVPNELYWLYKMS